MPIRCGRKLDPSVTRKAAELYLDDSLEIKHLVERFGVSRGSIYTAVARLREERGVAGPRTVAPHLRAL
jgi:transposase